MPTLTCKSSADTHVGVVRESNQDRFVCRDDIGLWAVADGMGGHEGGELASGTVARRLEAVPHGDDLGELLAATREALEAANAELIDVGSGFSPARAPGTTVVVMLIRGVEGAVAWAGDSRLYRLREGTAEQLTRDHSHVQQLVDEGLLAPEEAELHPLAHVLTNGIGIDHPLELESERLRIRPGDRYLLCSDGLSRLLSFEEIAAKMKTTDLEHSVQSMLDTTLDRGAPDNVTVVCVECSD